MITIQLDAVNISTMEAKSPTGERIAVVAYVDAQSGLRVLIPHDTNSARLVAAHLEGRPVIEIANGAILKPGPLGEAR